MGGSFAALGGKGAAKLFTFTDNPISGPSLRVAVKEVHVSYHNSDIVQIMGYLNYDAIISQSTSLLWIHIAMISF